MSWAKRQLLRARSKKTSKPLTLQKPHNVSNFECRQAEYLMRYGKEWLRHWWKDHPGMYEVRP